MADLFWAECQHCCPVITCMSWSHLGCYSLSSLLLNNVFIIAVLAVQIGIFNVFSLLHQLPYLSFVMPSLWREKGFINTPRKNPTIEQQIWIYLSSLVIFLALEMQMHTDKPHSCFPNIWRLALELEHYHPLSLFWSDPQPQFQWLLLLPFGILWHSFALVWKIEAVSYWRILHL